MKAMISQPMRGLTECQIVESRNVALKKLGELGYDVVNTLFTDEWYSQKNMKSRGVECISLCFLAKSLESMSLCSAVFFAKGWESARGCIIEHDTAVAYGLHVIYEE